MIEAGASFVARCFSGDIKHLTDVIVQATLHEGFSFIEVLQPAISYRKWEEYSKQIEYLEKIPEDRFEAFKIAKERQKFTIGVFYRSNNPIYHKELYGDNNPVSNSLSRETRLEKIRKILELK